MYRTNEKPMKIKYQLTKRDVEDAVGSWLQEQHDVDAATSGPGSNVRWCAKFEEDDVVLEVEVQQWAHDALDALPSHLDPRGLELHARLTAAGSFPQMSASEGHELSDWIGALLLEIQTR
jgi:hypothetical protein